MGKALVLTAGGILAALLNKLFVARLKAWAPWFKDGLLNLAVGRLPKDQRERFAEEWASHLNEISGDIDKIVFAWSCVSAATDMTSFIEHGIPAFSEREREFLRLLSTEPQELSLEQVSDLFSRMHHNDAIYELKLRTNPRTRRRVPRKRQS